jgi:hypothetical protein
MKCSGDLVAFLPRALCSSIKNTAKTQGQGPRGGPSSANRYDNHIVCLMRTGNGVRRSNARAASR